MLKTLDFQVYWVAVQIIPIIVIKYDDLKNKNPDCPASKYLWAGN